MACSFIASGLRVFDIRDPYKPEGDRLLRRAASRDSSTGGAAEQLRDVGARVRARARRDLVLGRQHRLLRAAGDQRRRGRSAAARAAAGAAPASARRSPIGPRNIGRVRLGYTRRRLLRRVGARPAEQEALASTAGASSARAGAVSAVLARRLAPAGCGSWPPRPRATCCARVGRGALRGPPGAALPACPADRARPVPRGPSQRTRVRHARAAGQLRGGSRAAPAGPPEAATALPAPRRPVARGALAPLALGLARLRGVLGALTVRHLPDCERALVHLFLDLRQLLLPTLLSLLLLCFHPWKGSAAPGRSRQVQLECARCAHATCFRAWS